MHLNSCKFTFIINIHKQTTQTTKFYRFSIWQGFLIIDKRRNSCFSINTNITKETYSIFVQKVEKQIIFFNHCASAGTFWSDDSKNINHKNYINPCLIRKFYFFCALQFPLSFLKLKFIYILISYAPVCTVSNSTFLLVESKRGWVWKPIRDQRWN